MNVISLFCGAGGMDLGFLKAGHNIIWANDYDQDSIESYQRYFCGKLGLDPEHIICEDIKKIDTASIPDGDVVIGGFPCQGFSMANPYRHVGDKRNELYLEFLRVVKDKNPKYFVAENVPGLCSIGGYETKEDKKKGEGRVLKLILKDFREAGYHVVWKLLKAVEFGVPQIRRRVVIMGTRNDIEQKITHPSPTHSYDTESGLKSIKTIWDAIGDLPEEPTNKILNHVGTHHKVKINGFLGNRKTDPQKPSPTIVGRGGGTGGPVIMPHPNSIRRLTVRECARIQCFPDDFEFMGSVSSCYRQIGNAVPVDLGFSIGKQLPI